MVQKSNRNRLDETSIELRRENLGRFQQLLLDANNFLLEREGYEVSNEIDDIQSAFDEKSEAIRGLIHSIIDYAQKKSDLLEDDQVEQLKSELENLANESKIVESIPSGLIRLLPIARNLFFPIIQNLKVRLENGK